MSPARTVVALASLKHPPYRVVLAEYVRGEIESNLAKFPPELTTLFVQFVKLLDPKPVRLPTPDEVLAVRGIIRHAHDEPVLASALLAPRPQVIVSDNIRDFNRRVSQKIGIPIMNCPKFLAGLEIRGL